MWLRHHEDRIESTLNVVHRDGLSGYMWWVREPGQVALAASVGAVLERILAGDRREDVHLFKANDRKLVFRFNVPGGAGGSVIAKVFMLKKLRKRLAYRRYALDEAGNLLRARAVGIRVPEVIGYGHLRSRFGLVKVGVVILEDLHDRLPVGAVLERKPPCERYAILQRTSSLFMSLYRAACDHIDVNSQGVMLSEHDADSEASLLDFQHARFYDEPSPGVLMFETGYFVRSCRQWISMGTAGRWLEELLDAIGVRDASEREKLRRAFRFYANADLSRKARIAISKQRSQAGTGHLGFFSKK